MGQQITKEVFAHVFKEAWLDTHLIVKAFRGSRIYPVDASKVGIKVALSKVFCVPAQESDVTSKHSAALEALEAQMSRETKMKFIEYLAEDG